ncbi:HNH endonuclease [Streptomyces sp. UH6]|uniref:HNH endonuclease n=1 Tax=Streptomyces sp. UH6 TaxID=2748379 RepID=UPI0015D49BC9|nr:HNH endonuclease [Streptomyces sp. UH6]NYV72973.1 HNH endonuclease [Streptomyces sp. UH6]
MAGNPRNGRPYRRLAADLRRRGEPCWLCGHDIDPTLDPRDPWSWTMDHVQPVSRRPDLLLDPANARPAHRRCNSSKGDRVTPRAVGPTSRRW